MCAKSRAQGYRVDVPEISTFFISNDGFQIIEYSDSKATIESNDIELEQILLGPVLMLALALNQLFGLHASSVRLGDRAILFTGDSGFGKSNNGPPFAAKVWFFYRPER